MDQENNFFFILWIHAWWLIEFESKGVVIEWKMSLTAIIYQVREGSYPLQYGMTGRGTSVSRIESIQRLLNAWWVVACIKLSNHLSITILMFSARRGRWKNIDWDIVRRRMRSAPTQTVSTNDYGLNLNPNQMTIFST